MRYILDNDGYIEELSTNIIYCDNRTCTEYTGNIPSGYDSLEEWVTGESGKLNAWKIVDGNLVFDNAKYDELKTLYEKQDTDNSYVQHKEIYDIQEQLADINDVNKSQYQKATATGKVISISNVKKVYPKIKLTNIDPYSFEQINLITTTKNMLPNTAYSQTISGVSFTQKENRSIKINGAATENIEYNISGSRTNTSAILVIKKNLNYYLTSGLTLKMYSYDGTDRTEVYSGTGGAISFTDSDKPITQIVLSIASGTTLNNVTVYPQLEYGEVATEYEMYKSNSLSINFSSYIEEGLFPSDNLFPSNNLFPNGTTIDYILIDNSTITISVNGITNKLENGNIYLFDGNDTIFTIQDTNIEMEYCINNLALEGTTTKNNNFKILEDGSIEAHNGIFSGGTFNLTDTNDGHPVLNVRGADGYSAVWESGFTTNFQVGLLNYQPSSIMSYLSGDNLISTLNLITRTPGKSIMATTSEGSDGSPYIKVGKNISSFSVLTGTGVWSPSFNNTSLESTKKNFEPFKNAIDIINDTDIYKYNLKSQEDGEKKHIGLVIGDKYKYSQEITNNSNDGVVLYSMISVCFQAIKEQQEQIETLQNKIKEMESGK